MNQYPFCTDPSTISYRVILVWTTDPTSGPPTIYPLCQSEEKDDRIVDFLQQKFNRLYR